MKRFRQLGLVLLLVTGLLLAAWAGRAGAPGRLHCVEFRCPNGDCFHTEDPAFLRSVEAWRRSIEGPSLRQRLRRLRGERMESGLRQADYQVTLVFESGRLEEMFVWVYAEDYVPV